MQKSFHVINSFIDNQLEDFYKLYSLKLIKSQSSEEYNTYKFTYLNEKLKKKTLRMEINLTKEKLSFGDWKDSSLQTVKFKNILSL